MKIFRNIFDVIEFQFRWLFGLIRYSHQNVMKSFKKKHSWLTLNEELFQKPYYLDNSTTYSIQYSHDENLLINNNKWGQWKIKNQKIPYSQYITSNGWRFLTPTKNYGVIGYPAIKKNISLKLSNLRILDINWKLKLYLKKRRYNVSFDFWLLNSQEWKWSNVKHEIMVWEDYFISKPFGKKIGRCVMDGIEYDVFTGYIDKTKENLEIDGWTYTCFKRRKPQRKTEKSGILNIEKCIHFLRQFEIISYEEYSQSLYLHSIELGTEVFNSDGICIVERFDVIDT